MRDFMIAGDMHPVMKIWATFWGLCIGGISIDFLVTMSSWTTMVLESYYVTFKMAVFEQNKVVVKSDC
jgi:hypothetical protein